MRRHLGLTGTLLAFLALVVLCSQWASYRTTSFLLESVVDAGQREKVHAVGSTLESLIAARTARLTDAARLLGSNERLARRLAGSDGTHPAGLTTVLDEYRNSTGLETLTVTDLRGVVLYRAHDPARRGDGARWWGISEALAGAGLLVSSVDRGAVVIHAIEPVRLDGKIVGAVAAGVRLNPAFLESLARAVGARLVLMSRQGPVAASHEQAERQLDAAAVTEAFYQKIPIFRTDPGSRTTTVYLPLLIVDEAYVVAAEIDSTPAYALLGASSRRYAVIAGAILAASSLIGLAVFSYFLAPLRHLRTRAERTALEITGSPIKTGRRGGEIASAVQALDALTERLLARNRELAEVSTAAQAASRAKSDFLSRMSHEIRTPLNGVLGMAELLQNTALDRTQERYCLALAASGRMLHALLNDILDLAKIEAGKLQVETTAFEPRSLAREIADTYRELASTKGITLVPDLDQSAPDALLGDPTRLRQALINLLGNALKFTPQGGRITFTLRALDVPSDPARRWLRFSVADTGIGMDREALSAMFKPFAQADTSTSRTYGGTGLGLTITKHLIELMGGSLHLDSALGQGTIASFDLPFDVAPSPPAPGRPAGPLPVPCSARVLVAEDNVVNQEVIMAMLSQLGATTTLVDNGALAVEAVQRDQFDLVLMDCQMPALDGYEATAKIRAAESGNHRLPIIALTANAFAEDRQRCLEAGMDDYLAKPITSENLALVLSRWAGPQDRTACGARYAAKA